jgi:hypothetical protein
MCFQWKENLGGPLLKKQKQKNLFKSEEYGIDENRDLKYIYPQTTSEILIKQWRKNVKKKKKKKETLKEVANNKIFVCAKRLFLCV